MVGITKIELAVENRRTRRRLDVRLLPHLMGRDVTIRATNGAGTDYPIGYVRWTEQRNFDACLHLMKTGQVESRRD